ncbi:hypothetical protein LZ31DRAFT_620150 [Colletotrichum somersetense]|nr:hypothetical protein LZ31DRAFT_620150 [Colletotrichum somersetense]
MEFLSMTLHESQLHFASKDSSQVDKVTVGAAILRKDTSAPSVLLLKRNSNVKHYPNVFEIPGRNVEATYPTVRDATIREVGEETQLMVLGIVSPLSSIRCSTEKLEKPPTGLDEIFKRNALQLSYIVSVQGTDFRINKEEHSMRFWATRNTLDWIPITLEMRGLVLEVLDSYEDLLTM